MLSRTILGLFGLFATALVLRLAVVLALSTQHRAPLTYEHGEIARNLLLGRGFSVTFLGVEGPTSQQAPLYPTLLAAAFWLFGETDASDARLGQVEPRVERAVLAVQLLQCLAGAGLAVSAAWLAWSLLPERPAVGWLCGWGAAVYPTHIYMATHIQVASWAALCLTLLAAVVISTWRGRWTQAVVAGALSGMLLLIEPILALALPILAVALVMSVRTKPQANGTLGALQAGLAMAAVAAVVIAPWLWRNYRVHGELVFVKSTFGYAFWQGNNDISWGTDKVPKASAEALRKRHDGTLAGMDRALWEARHETLYIDDVLLKPSGYHEFAGLSEPARSRLLGERAWAFIAAHPGRYLQLCGQRLRYFLMFDETNPKAANLLYRAGSVLWLGLCLAGLGVALRRGELSQLWPTLAVFAAVALFHTLTIVSARFRIPVEPLTFVWCAIGVEQGWRALAAAVSRRADTATLAAARLAEFTLRQLRLAFGRR